jgi:hypothetical protein
MRTGIGKLVQVGVVVGAVGSAALMLHVGSRNPSSVLMVLFAGWVLSPFIALGFADRASTRWPPAARALLNGLGLIVTLGSLAIYASVDLRRPAQPAFMFLVVPLVSWLLVAGVVTAATFMSPRQQGQ